MMTIASAIVIIFILSVRISLHLAFNQIFHGLATEIALYDFAVGTEKNYLWNTLDAIHLCGIVLVSLWNEYLGICDAFFG